MSGRTTIGDVTLRYTVDPARVGLNQLNLYLLQDGGRPYRAREARPGRAAQPRRTKGEIPQDVPLELVGPGHYVNSATQFDAAGLWRLEVRRPARRARATTWRRSGSRSAE